MPQSSAVGSPVTQATTRGSERNQKKQETKEKDKMASKIKGSTLQEKEDILPVPSPIDQKVFNKLTPDKKMGNFLSVINMLCKKLDEHDIQLNHDSDEIDVRIQLTQHQADDNTSRLAGAESTLEERKSQFQTMGDKLSLKTDKISKRV